MTELIHDPVTVHGSNIHVTALIPLINVEHLLVNSLFQDAILPIRDFFQGTYC